MQYLGSTITVILVISWTIHMSYWQTSCMTIFVQPKRNFQCFVQTFRKGLFSFVIITPCWITDHNAQRSNWIKNKNASPFFNQSVKKAQETTIRNKPHEYTFLFLSPKNGPKSNLIRAGLFVLVRTWRKGKPHL